MNASRSLHIRLTWVAIQDHLLPWKLAADAGASELTEPRTASTPDGEYQVNPWRLRVNRPASGVCCWRHQADGRSLGYSAFVLLDGCALAAGR